MTKVYRFQTIRTSFVHSETGFKHIKVKDENSRHFVSHDTKLDHKVFFLNKQCKCDMQFFLL